MAAPTPPPRPATVVPYATRGGDRATLSAAARDAAGLAAVLAVAWVVVMAGALVVVPRFVEAVFRDFRMELPVATKAAMLWGRWVTSDYGWAYLALAVVMVPLAMLPVYQHRPDRSRPGMWAVRIIGLLLFVLLFVVAGVVVVLFLPMLSLMRAVR